jgi:two-component sensor histidine kinase
LPEAAIARIRRRNFALLAGLLLIVSALVVLGTFAFLGSSASEREARRVAEETQQMLGHADSLLISLLDAETGQRGYLLTGDTAYLEPFVGRHALFDQDLAQLKAFASGPRGTPGMLARLDHIGALGTERFALLERGIAARRAGNMVEAVAIILSGRGKSAMDAIRDELGQLRRAEQARFGEALRGANDSQRSTARLLVLLVSLVLLTLILSAFLLRRAIRSEIDARFATELRQQRDRADLVSRELSHRVKNLFAVIMSIISTTGRSETDAREVARKIRERVQALARAHAVSNGLDRTRASLLKEMIHAIVDPYAPPGREAMIEGPEVFLGADRVTPVGLILNELATNALKYGAWSRPGGTLHIEWAFTEGADKGPARPFRLTWTEGGEGAEIAPPDKQGFGTMMIDLSATQARANLSRQWTKDGLVVIMDFETDGISESRNG